MNNQSYSCSLFDEGMLRLQVCAWADKAVLQLAALVQRHVVHDHAVYDAHVRRQAAVGAHRAPLHLFNMDNDN